MHAFNLNEAIPLLPDNLADMVVRGAYLEQSARLLDQSHRELATCWEVVQASQKPFLDSQGRQTGPAIDTAAPGPLQDFALTDLALSMNKRLAEHLRRCCETELETWLAARCEEYSRGLEAGRGLPAWERALQSVDVDAHHLILTLSTVRNLAAAGCAAGLGEFSLAAKEAVGQAQVDALKVEAGLAAINAITETRDRLLRPTVFADPVPAIRPQSLAPAVAKIGTLPMAQVQAECRRLIAAVEDLVDREIHDLIEHAHALAHEHPGRMKAYVRSAWNQLHVHAVAHSVEAEHIGEVVAQTERLYANAVPRIKA